MDTRTNYYYRNNNKCINIINDRYYRKNKGEKKMNGIKISDCKFYINEAARVVICVIPNTQLMVTDFIHEHFRWKDIDFWMSIEYILNQLAMPCSFMGKAVCAEEDEWNEETGRLIAFSRAKDKCYKSFFKRANKLIQIFDRRLNDMIDEFNDFGEKLDNKKLILQEKINKATGAE